MKVVYILSLQEDNLKKDSKGKGEWSSSITSLSLPMPNELTHDCVKHYVAITSATVKTAEVKGLIVY